MGKLPERFVRSVAKEVPDLSLIPLFGNAPPFEWEKFSHLLSEKFQIGPLVVTLKEQRWGVGEELREGIGQNLLVIPLTLTPLHSPIYWAMSLTDIGKLTSWMLDGQGNGKAFSSEILEEGFYRYLLLEALDAAAALNPLKTFTLQLGEEASLPEEGAFCIDAQISFKEASCWGRLFLSSSFKNDWTRHFSHLPSEYVPSNLSRQTPLTIGIKTGSVLLTQKEWGLLELGDFLALDRHSYHAKTKKGAAQVVLGSTPLFQVHIKENKIEILDYASNHEVPMEKPSPNSDAAIEEVSSIKELPMNVSIEIARLKMSLDQLMHLHPGNTLELPIQLDQAVSLVVNGQKVGRAELVYLGDVLGIRILEVG